MSDGADPWDYSGRYNTELAPADEAAYRQWAAQLSAKLKRDITRDAYDYDMQGAWKAGAGAAENGHFPDTFKKPNHPTFSDQSQYHGVDEQYGGTWGSEVGAFTFTPGPANLKAMSREQLLEYLKRADPGVQLRMPI